MDYKEADG
jgi:uncharacterized membrane protein